MAVGLKDNALARDTYIDLMVHNVKPVYICTSSKLGRQSLCI